MKNLILLFLFFYSLMYGQSPNKSTLNILTKEEINYLKENTFNIYINDWEPFVILDETMEGTPIIEGIAIDFFKTITKDIPIKYNFITVNKFTDILNNLEKDPLGVTLSTSKTKDKEKYASFTHVYNSFPIAIMTKDDVAFSNSMNEFDEKKIAVGKNFTAHKILKQNYPKIKLVPVNNTIEALDLLARDEVYGASDILPVVLFSEKRYGYDHLKVSGITDENYDIRILANKQSSELIKILNKLVVNTPRKEITKINKSWFNTNFQDVTPLSIKEQSFIDNNKFTICPRVNHFPLSDYKNGDIIGIGGDIFKEIAKKINLEYKVLQSKTQKELYENISSNKCDIVATLKYKQTRFENIETMIPIFNTFWASIGNFKSIHFDDYTDYSRHTFYVKEEFHKKIVHEHYPTFNIIVENNIDNIFNTLKEDKFSHFLNIGITAEYLVQKYGVKDFKINGVLSKINLYGSMGINKNHPLLLTSMNKAFSKIDKKRIYDIVHRYEIKEYTIEKNYNIYFVYIIFASILIIIILYYFVRKFSNQKDTLKKEEQKLNLAASSGNIGIWEWDMRKNVIDWNDKMYEMYEISQDNKLPNYEIWKNSLHKDSIKKVEKELNDAIKNNKKFDTTFKIDIKGKIKYIKATGIIKYQDFEPVNMIGTNIDITESVLYKLNLEKEKEIALIQKEKAIEAKEEMKIIQEKLIHASEAKSEFLANMSHEIRTPLAGIIGLTDLMLEDECTDYQKEQLTIIKNSSNTLKAIINDILDFSKIQSGKFEIRPNEFNLDAIIKDIENLFKPQVISKDIDFNIKIDSNVEKILIGDSLRIHQILTNLVGNAIKFTDLGKVELSVRTLNKNDVSTKLQFVIEDTGIGMNKKLQDKIFESFTQGELSNTKSYKGTGLGLTISKLLAELMNGTLEFESYEDIGSKFFLTLNLEFVKNKKNKSIISDEIKVFKVKKGTRVLVAEDSEVNQLVITKTLSKIGFDVTIANDGKEAVDLLKKEKFELIFMDIQMPNMDGYEATQKIRLFNKNIPIIALSAAVLPQDIQNSINHGMNEHIKKPIDKNILFNTISKYIKNISIESHNEIENKKIDNDLFEIEVKNAMEKFKEEFGEDSANIILNAYLNQYKNFKEELTNLKNSDLDKYIHKLKGSSGNMRFNQIYNLCLEIEKKDNKQKNKYLIEKLINLLSKVYEEFN